MSDVDEQLVKVTIYPKGNRVILLHDKKIIIHPDGTKTEEMLKEPQPVARECFFYSLVALLLFFGVIGVLIYKGGCA